VATNKLHVKKNDVVVVISGKDQGKKGKVLTASPSTGKVIVEGANIMSKHQKPSQKNQQGGIIKQEGPIFASKVMLYCDKCKQGVRVGHKFLQDGTKVRVCKKCGETFNK
jgi:large subunit ribosomal protein L24